MGDGICLNIVSPVTSKSCQCGSLTPSWLSLSWSSEPSRPGETRDHTITPLHNNQTRPHQDEPSSPSPDQSQSRLSLPPAAGRKECSQVPGRHFPLTWRLSLGQSPGPEVNINLCIVHMSFRMSSFMTIWRPNIYDKIFLIIIRYFYFLKSEIGFQILPALSWDPRGRHPLQHWQVKLVFSSDVSSWTIIYEGFQTAGLWQSQHSPTSAGGSVKCAPVTQMEQKGPNTSLF